MPNVISLNYAQPANMQATAAVANSTAVGSAVTATVYPYGTAAAGLTTVVVPSNEVWHLTGAYVQASQTQDYNIGFIVNGITQPLLIEANATIVTNSARFVLPTTLVFPPNSSFQVSITLLASTSAGGAFTATFYMTFVRQPLQQALGK